MSMLFSNPSVEAFTIASTDLFIGYGFFHPKQWVKLLKLNRRMEGSCVQFEKVCVGRCTDPIPFTTYRMYAPCVPLLIYAKRDV